MTSPPIATPSPDETASHPSSPGRATRKTLLLNLSEQQVSILERASQIDGYLPTAEHVLRCEQLAQRSMLAVREGKGYGTTDFGKAALSAYRHAERVGQIKEVQ